MLDTRGGDRQPEPPAAPHAPAAPAAAVEGPRGSGPAPDAGRELDALVAERVFGWTVTPRNGEPYRCFESRQGPRTWTHQALVPAFSTDLRAAMEVVEHFGAPARGQGVELVVELVKDARGRWHARFVRWRRASPGFVAAPTLPLAICHAALTALAFARERSAPPEPGSDVVPIGESG